MHITESSKPNSKAETERLERVLEAARASTAAACDSAAATLVTTIATTAAPVSTETLEAAAAMVAEEKHEIVIAEDTTSAAAAVTDARAAASEAAAVETAARASVATTAAALETANAAAKAAVAAAAMESSPKERRREQFLVPDTAHNNMFDKPAADYFYRLCQKERVPLIVVGRHAAYPCPMPRSIYDDMARTNHPIGKRLKDTQRDSIEALWKRACAPSGSTLRLGLPPRCDKAWFVGTFCAGRGLERGCDDSIWDLVVSFIMYDSIALLCAIPATRHFFGPLRKRVRGVDHLVIGAALETPGLNSEMIEELQDFMYTSFFRGVTMDFSEFSGTSAAFELSDELRAREARLSSHCLDEVRFTSAIRQIDRIWLQCFFCCATRWACVIVGSSPLRLTDPPNTNASRCSRRTCPDKAHQHHPDCFLRQVRHRPTERLLSRVSRHRVWHLLFSHRRRLSAVPVPEDLCQLGGYVLPLCSWLVRR